MKTAEDLKLPVPGSAPAARTAERDVENVVLQPTPELERVHRADRGPRRRVASGPCFPTEDNMLLIATDGRKAALDLRLVDQD